MAGEIERNISNLHDQDTGLLTGYINPITRKREPLDSATVQAVAEAYEDAGSPAFARTYTWATLPAAADYIGTAYITDVGLHGSLWRSDGSTWGVVGGSVLLAVNNVAGTTLTGSTSETLDYTYTIPAGLMGLNGAIEMQAKYTCTNNANVKTLRARLGGLAGTVVNDPQLTTSATAHFNTRIENRNSQAVQQGVNGTFNYTVSTNAWRSATVNTAVAVDLVITLQLASAGDSINRETVRVFLHRP